MNKLRLQIGPVIAMAEALRERVKRELPAHTGLASLAEGAATAARQADHVSQQLKSPFGLHRLPATFLALALFILIGWLYVTFFRTATLTIAIPERDALAMRTHMSGRLRVEFRPAVVLGSREAVERVNRGWADLAFVQGGISIPADLQRVELPGRELVLWFVRTSVQDLGNVNKVLTSVPGEGSHTVAQLFMEAWQITPKVEYVHEWRKLTDEDQYVVGDDVDAVFVVKDPADEKTLKAATRLAAAGFRLDSPRLGARGEKLDFLRATTIRPGYLQSVPPFPEQPIESYSVATFLVARKGLTPRLLGVASHLVEGKAPSFAADGFEPTVTDASEIFQGIEAFLGIIINIGLAFLALLGLEMLTFRKRFHELNSLVSLISIHQSSKDVLGTTEPDVRRNNLIYLSLCSDLLGLVSMIAGYYTQENASLLFNSLPEIVHQRCDALKINIQLKILHATIGHDILLEPQGSQTEVGGSS